MSIDTSRNIIPSNIRETLNQGNEFAPLTLGKSTVAPKTLAGAHGNVLSSMKSLSATRYVNVGDTHGKSGFSALSQILSNIRHNIKALFAGDGSAERTSMERSINALWKFAKKENINRDDVEGLQQKLQLLYSAVKSAKEEHVQQGNDWNNIKFGAEAMYNANKTFIAEYAEALKNKIDTYRQENTNYGTFEKFARNISDPSLMVDDKTKKLYEAYRFLQGNPFEKLALRAFTIVPGDIKATEALSKVLKDLRDLAKIVPDEARHFNDMINSRILNLQSSNPNVSSLPLVDRLETALRTIAEKVSVS